jgi:hypothetical protein
LIEVAFPLAIEKFPNLETLFINPYRSMDHTLFAEIGRFRSMRHLQISGDFDANGPVFKAFSGFDNLHTLKMKLYSLTYDDCTILASVVPMLKVLSLDFMDKSCSREGFVKLLDSLPQLEVIENLPNGILHRVSHNLPLLHKLSLCAPTEKDLNAIGSICKNVVKLTFNVPKVKQGLLYYMQILRPCHLLSSLRSHFGLLLSPSALHCSPEVGFPTMKSVQFCGLNPANGDDIAQFLRLLCFTFPHLEDLFLGFGSDCDFLEIRNYLCKNLKSLESLSLRRTFGLTLKTSVRVIERIRVQTN